MDKMRHIITIIIVVAFAINSAKPTYAFRPVAAKHAAAADAEASLSNEHGMPDGNPIVKLRKTIEEMMVEACESSDVSLITDAIAFFKSVANSSNPTTYSFALYAVHLARLRLGQLIEQHGIDKSLSSEFVRGRKVTIRLGSYNEIRLSITPTKSGDIQAKADDCLDQIRSMLKEEGLDWENVVMLTTFVKSDITKTPIAQREAMLTGIRDFCGGFISPTSVIEQTPFNGGDIAMEVIILAPTAGDSIDITHKELGGVHYAVVEHDGLKQVYAAGIAASSEEGRLAQSRKALSLMAAILKEEGLSFAQVTRQWNYIEKLTRVVTTAEGEIDNYIIFCGARGEAYKAAEFRNGYPAATGIGIARGGVCLEFIAMSDERDKLDVVAVENPDQVNPYDYPDRVIPAPDNKPKPKPAFERENLIIYNPFDQKIVTVKSNVSGTASVRGPDVLFGIQETFPANVPIDHIVSGFGGLVTFLNYAITYGTISDSFYVSAETAVEAQTWTTIDLIAGLLQKEALHAQGIDASAGLDNVSQIRVYVKYEEDIPKVKEICDRVFIGIPALFVHSDVCRDGWLVEIEATAAFVVDTANIQRPDSQITREIPPIPPVMADKIYQAIATAA